MNTETTKRLAIFERKVLRRILGAVKINDTWRKRNNSELTKFYDDVDIVSFIRLSRLRWIGHVNRMDKENRWMDCVLSDIKNARIGTGRSSQGI